MSQDTAPARVRLRYDRIDFESDKGARIHLVGGRCAVWIGAKFLQRGLDRDKKVLTLPEWLATEKMDEARQELEPGSKEWRYEPLLLEQPSKWQHDTMISVNCQLVKRIDGSAKDGEIQKLRVFLFKNAVKEGRVARQVVVKAALRAIEKTDQGAHETILGGSDDYFVRGLLAAWPLSFEHVGLLLTKEPGK